MNVKILAAALYCFVLVAIPDLNWSNLSVEAGVPRTIIIIGMIQNWDKLRFRSYWSGVSR